MFVVIFEVQPKKERFDDYLDLAKSLKPELEKIDGFIDNERFYSKRTEGRVLSLSTWRDEKAVIRWRTHGMHHGVQKKGRYEVFMDYHLRVGEIVAEYDSHAGQKLPGQRFDETEVGLAKAATISEFSLPEGETANGDNFSADFGLSKSASDGLVDHEVFESIYHPGKLLLLASWRDATVAAGWQPQSIEGYAMRHRLVRVIRDYGMEDRREAPQYYSSVERIGGTA
jgi:heme-degrading monooxygenase HmoA